MNDNMLLISFLLLSLLGLHLVSRSLKPTNSISAPWTSSLGASPLNQHQQGSAVVEKRRGGGRERGVGGWGRGKAKVASRLLPGMTWFNDPLRSINDLRNDYFAHPIPPLTTANAVIRVER